MPLVDFGAPGVFFVPVWIVLLEKYLLGGQRVKFDLQHGPWTDRDRKFLSTRPFNLTSSFSAFSPLLRHMFPNFCQHF